MKWKLLAEAVLVVALLPAAARADLPDDHPGYVHALTNLRNARRNLEHRPGDAAISVQENIAITEIDRAIGEIKKVSREDVKDQSNSRREDANLDRLGRLHRTVELLEMARSDLANEEDRPDAIELKHRAQGHVDRAIEVAKHVAHDVERNH